MLYPSPSLMQQLALEMTAKGMPYFKEAVVCNASLARRIYHLHSSLEKSQSALERESFFVETISAVISLYADIQIPSIDLGKEQRIVSLIKQYLWDNFRTNISLEDLVKLTNLNRYYLIRLFRSAVGLPPYTYLTQIRMEKAKQMLARGESVSQVAIAVGLSDQSHLNRYFKRIFGITPARYRRMSTSFKTNLD